MSQISQKTNSAPHFPFLNPEILMALLLFVLVYGMSRQAAILVTSAKAASSVSISEEEKIAQNRPVIVLDSGHGGMDPGKVAVNGSLEKDLNLAIALKVKKYLEASDVEVILTRDSDADLSETGAKSRKMSDMKARCKRINDIAPDLTVSIHQNSYHEPDVKGGQVFYYKNSEAGKRLAQILQKRFDYLLGEHNTRQAKANDSYYMLLHVKCPIVIVECGFLSNPQDAAALLDEDYQDRLAWTIHMGIMQYLNNRSL